MPTTFKLSSPASLGRCPVMRGGGVMSISTVAHDPSVREDADTSSAKLGRRV